MDFDLTDAQKALRDKAREIAERELAALAAEIDREQRYPQRSVKRLAELGMLGLTIPRAWGGAGADHLSCALAIEELGSACAATASIIGAQNLLVCQPILRFGTEAQRRSWLPGLATGSNMGCFAASDPGAPDGIVARRDGDGWVLRGSAPFVPAAPVAQCAIVIAGMPAQTSGANPMSAFILPMDSAGVAVGPAQEKLGLRGAPAAALALDEVSLPAGALLGGEGAGGEVWRYTAEGGRLGTAALAVGIARAAFAASTRYASTEQRAGQPVAEQQTVQFMLAEMSAQIDAARIMTWRAAAGRDGGGNTEAATAMAKLLACQTATRVAGDAMQVLGRHACLPSCSVERHFRDAKVAGLMDGTSDKERLGIASVLLKD